MTNMMKLSTVAAALTLSAVVPTSAFAPTQRHAAAASVVSPLHYWVGDQEFSSNSAAPSSASKQSSNTLEARIQACLTGPSPCDVEYMAILWNELELLASDCTEECHQTSPECDLAAKEERDILMQLLQDKMEEQQQKQSAAAASTVNTQDYTHEDDDLVLELDHKERIVNPSLDTIQALLQTENNSFINDVAVLTSLYSYLEQQMNACTEDATQTDLECDLYAKEQREELLTTLGDRITAFQAQTNDCLSSSSSSNNKNQPPRCYQICDTAAIAKTLENLQELTCLCTEEGYQTAAFCDIIVKEERDVLMERLRHQLDLAEEMQTRMRSRMTTSFMI